MATRDVTAPTALTLKTVLRDYSTGTERLWNTSGTPGFQAYNGSNIADYGITTTEGSPGSYKWTVPASLAALATGEYKSKTYRIAGSNLVTGDLANIVYEDSFWWNGTTFAPPTAGAAPTVAEIAAGLPISRVTVFAPPTVERPSTSTTSYLFEVWCRNSSGALADSDTDAVTIKLRDPADINLATPWTLAGPSKPSTGIYRYTIAVPSTYAYASAYLSASATISGSVFSGAAIITVLNDTATQVSDAVVDNIAERLLLHPEQKLYTGTGGQTLPRAITVTQS